MMQKKFLKEDGIILNIGKSSPKRGAFYCGINLYTLHHG
jgi:hypothetical protein